MLMEMAVSRRCGEEKKHLFFDKSNAANLPRSGDNCRGCAYLFSVECVCVLSVFLSVCLFVESTRLPRRLLPRKQVALLLQRGRAMLCVRQ